MKLTVTLLFLAVTIVGCQRERYQVGNVDAPASSEAPAYTVKVDPNSAQSPK